MELEKLGPLKKVFCQLSTGIGNFGAVKKPANQQWRIQPIRRLAQKVLHPNAT
jgi:hypothetical protein